MTFGLGLTKIIPFLIYLSGIFVALLSIFSNPRIGVYFLFPLLPYQNIFARIATFPMGKDLNDILFLSILIGWCIHRKRSPHHNALRNFKPYNTQINLSVSLLVISSLIGFIISSAKSGLLFDLSNIYFIQWKNYMMLPLCWFLTSRTLNSKKEFKVLLSIVIVGFIAAVFYFYRDLQFMDLSHFSYTVRSKMTGLFVYLGPNHYAAFFTHFLFILIGLALFARSVFVKIIFYVVILVTGYCILFTFSRGAYAALVLGLFFVGVIKDKRILIFLVVIFLAWNVLLPESVIERITMTQNEEGELENSAAIRVELWEIALGMFKSSPVFGNGFNSFSGKGFHDAHNFYMKMLAELGLMGLFPFLFLLQQSFVQGWRLYRKAKDWMLKGLGLGFSACVLALAVTNMFGDRWSYVSMGSYFWVFLGIITRANIIENTEK